MLGGCVLHEAYSTPTGYVGNSFNAYDRATGSWHQTWVDNAGTVLKLDGGMVDGIISIAVGAFLLRATVSEFVHYTLQQLSLILSFNSQLG